MTAGSLVDPEGPLVVSLGSWGIPSGARGVLERPAVAQAALLGVSVVLVVGDDPAAGVQGDAKVKGTDKNDAGQVWRQRFETPAGSKVTAVWLRHDVGGAAGPFGGLSGAELCAVLAHLRRLLGVPWARSTGTTAEDLILSTHPRQRGGRKLDTVPDVPEPARSAGLEQPLQAWSRPLVEFEAGAEWVHTYDANAAFLGPWQTVDLGFGKTTHHQTRSAAARHAHLPGVWRVELDAGWHDGLGAGGTPLPPIAPRLTLDPRSRRLEGWVMTPTLHRLSEFAESQGWREVVPEEGHSWGQRSRYLQAAGVRLRDARAESMAMRDGALAGMVGAASGVELATHLLRYAVAGTVVDAVADLYRVQVGRMASEVPAPWWRRPDWSNTIRASYRAGLHRKIQRWGWSPFAIATDALAFATDEADPVVFADSIGLRLGVGLGEYKVQGTCRRELVDAHQGQGPRGVLRTFQTAAGKLPAVAVRGA